MTLEDKKQGKGERRFASLLRRGTQHLKAGRLDKATTLLERAHALNEDHLDAALNLSGAYILNKKFKKATPLLEALSQKYPDNAMIWLNLGAAYLGNPILARDDEQQKALKAFKQAHTINPATPHVAYNIGLIYRDRRETVAAIHWFEKALAANPKDKDAKQLIEKLRQQDEGDTNIPL